MAGTKQLGFPKTSACNLREQAARTTLRNVRLQGHTYVDVRVDGKRFIFFCTLCLAPCYSDTTLFDHLKGHLHAERYAAAKVTLLGSNPWPFNDGVLFFHDSSEKDKQFVVSNSSKQSRFLNIVDSSNELTLTRVDETSNTKNGDKENDKLVIPGVVLKDEVSDLEVRFLGYGEIGARISNNDEIASKIGRIWCGWLGKENSYNKNEPTIPDYDFALVTFPFEYELGIKGFFDDLSPMFSSSPRALTENSEVNRKKRKKSLSDPEDISESMNDQCSSSGEDTSLTCPRLLFDRYDDQLQLERFISSKTIRRELRLRQRVASEKMCDICQHKMIPGKDVATLLNAKTGRLVCSSRNTNGAFHVFHTSCLIHWLLFCESEIWTNQLTKSKVTRRSGKKSGTKRTKKQMDVVKSVERTQLYSVFCPECQGTGINIEGDQLEKPTINVSEMFINKIKISDAHKAWMKNPEILQYCSTGLSFPSQSEDTVQENVSCLKLLRFYQAGV